jgi:hypothetical protein
MDKSEKYLRLLKLLEDIQNPDWGRLTYNDFSETTILELLDSGFAKSELNADLERLLEINLELDTAAGYRRCQQITNWIAEVKNCNPNYNFRPLR